jgi:hypothetical protein
MEKVSFSLRLGTYFYSEGRRYDGDWKDGRRDGKGLAFI